MERCVKRCQCVRNDEVKMEDNEDSHTLGEPGKGVPKESEVDRRGEVCELEGSPSTMKRKKYRTYT